MAVFSTSKGEFLFIPKLNSAQKTFALRLQVTLAKMQQSLPEMKRDGSIVAGSLWSEMLYGENSTTRAAAILSQSEFIPKLIKQLQDTPDKVVADFNEIREYRE